MNNTHGLPEIRRAIPTSIRREYAKRLKKHDTRFSMNLKLDAVTTSKLVAAQHLNPMKTTDGLLLSRTVLIRRAVLLYSQQLVVAAQCDDNQFLINERDALVVMTSNGKKQKGVAHE